MFLSGSVGDGWQQPSLLLRHDSVDSGVAKGGHGGLAGVPCWKEAPPTWHGAPRGVQDGHHHQGRHTKRTGPGGGDRDRQGGHRQRNGNFHPRKSAPGTLYQDKFPNDEHSREDNLKFVEEDFVSNNLILHSLKPLDNFLSHFTVLRYCAICHILVNGHSDIKT